MKRVQENGLPPVDGVLLRNSCAPCKGCRGKGCRPATASAHTPRVPRRAAAEKNLPPDCNYWLLTLQTAFSHRTRFPCPLVRFFARPVSHYFCWDNKIFALFTNFLDIYCNLRKLFKCPTKKVNILRSIFRLKASSKLTYLTRVVDNIDKTTRFFYSFIQTAQIYLDKEFEK